MTSNTTANQIKITVKNLTEIESIARHAHVGQKRRDGVTPYILHPLRVADILAAEGESNEVIAAGVLHDVLEDTRVTASDLRREGVPRVVIKTVETLTHQRGESYVEYIQRVSKSPMATAVKLADIRANMEDAPTDRQIVKYTNALEILKDAEPKDAEPKASGLMN